MNEFKSEKEITKHYQKLIVLNEQKYRDGLIGRDEFLHAEGDILGNFFIDSLRYGFKIFSSFLED